MSRQILGTLVAGGKPCRWRAVGGEEVDMEQLEAMIAVSGLVDR